MPPSWAYPYATVWDDFDGSYQVVEDSPSTSGGEWLIWPRDVDVPGELDPLYRGATGGGRSGVGAALLTHLDAGINSGWTGLGRARIVASGLAANNAYVRSEIFFGRSDGIDGIVDFGLTILMDPDPNGPQFLLGPLFDLIDIWVDGAFLGQGWVVAGLQVGAIAPPWSLNGYEPLFTVPLTWGDLTGWHRYEVQLADDEVKLLMDDAVLGSVANPLLAQVPQGVALTLAGGTRDTPGAGETAGGVNFADNFEAGLLVLLPTPVPVLRAAPGPSHVHFQPPRINT